MKGEIGVIGLAVMGQNLILNLLDHKFNVAVFNRTTSKVDNFMKNWKYLTNCAETGIPIPTYSLKEFVSNISSPRKILLMIQAGQAIDELLHELVPLLAQGDIVIDSGNSQYIDTQRRAETYSTIQYVGCGISGGEQGARHGPALMPGGPKRAWDEIKVIFQSVAATGPGGRPCCEWLGPDGAGHFVKMVHNGIEYADMQMISEVFHFASILLKQNITLIASMFNTWNQSSDLSSYLIEITGEILSFQDGTSKPLVSKIRDTAGQKGTGKWTVEAALDLGVPGTLFAEAVFSRCLSSDKQQRLESSKFYTSTSLELKDIKLNCSESSSFLESISDFNDDSNISSLLSESNITRVLGDALLAAKIIAYAQGFALLMKASTKHSWSLSGAIIAQIWQGGCIIRSKLLGIIENLKEFDNLLLSDWVHQRLLSCIPSLRKVVMVCIARGIPAPALSSALAYFDALCTSYLPGIALVQAQRDYFGAHQYELEESPGTFHHTNWTGNGGSVLSSTYQV